MTKYSNMRHIKEHNHSIFYIKYPYRKLIEYDILTGKQYIHYKAVYIYDYYISDTDFVIHFFDHGKDYLFWRKIFNKSKIIKCKGYCSNSCFLNTAQGLHVMDCWDSYVQNYVGIIPLKISGIFISSYDGKKIIVNKQKYSYIKTIDQLKLDDIFKTSDVDMENNADLNWINPSYLVISELGYHVKIYNPKTEANCIINNFPDIRFVIGCHLVLVFTYIRQLRVYDAESLIWITNIKYDFEIVAFNNQFEIIISRDMQYYRINNDGLEKVNFGQNYLIDCKWVPKKIKTIMDIVLDVLDLPNEISCIELYQAVILIRLQNFPI